MPSRPGPSLREAGCVRGLFLYSSRFLSKHRGTGAAERTGDDACFLRVIEDEQVLGYENGTVETLNHRSGKRLFALELAPLTDVRLDLTMAYGVATCISWLPSAGALGKLGKLWGR